MDEQDMIYQRNEDGTIQTGGYQLNNAFLHNNVGPYTVIEQKGGSLGSLSSIIGDLAIPTGLLFLQQNYKKHSNANSKGVISTKLYDSLLSMIEEPTKKSKTSSRNTRKRRSKRSASNKKTRSRK